MVLLHLLTIRLQQLADARFGWCDGGGVQVSWMHVERTTRTYEYVRNRQAQFKFGMWSAGWSVGW